VPNTTVSERVVIAVDPHKASWTAAAVGSALAPLDTLRTPVSRQGYRQLRRFAARWPDAEWAIEGATGLGAPLATWLSGDGIEAVDVPAKLATRVRMLSTGHGRKNDDADAVSVGIAALTAPGLRSAAVEDAIITLRALVEHRDDTVRTPHSDDQPTARAAHRTAPRWGTPAARRRHRRAAAAHRAPAGDRASHPSAAGRRAHR